MRRGSQKLAIASFFALAQAMPAGPGAQLLGANLIQPAGAPTITVTSWPEFYTPPPPPNASISSISSISSPSSTPPSTLDPSSPSRASPEAKLIISISLANFSVISPPLPFLVSGPDPSPSSAQIASPPATTISPPAGGCGPVSQYFNQKASDWNKANTSQWLDNWWASNAAHFGDQNGGFAALMGAQYLNQPDWTCRTDGSTTNCNLSPCTAVALNSAGKDMQAAYYVLEGVTRLHTYFVGLSQVLSNSAIGAALTKDGWATSFFANKGITNFDALKNVLMALNTIVGIAAAMLGFLGMEAAIAGGVVAALFGASVGFTLINVKSAKDEMFNKAADLGATLSRVFIQSLKDLISGNNLLMSGGTFAGVGDIRTFLKGGGFSQYSGMDQVKLINAYNAMLLSVAVNGLWRQQKVFIMGGGPCDDSAGIGSGPQTAKVCRDGKAWYLYFWEETHRFTLTRHRLGWVTSPPGANQLGQGDYADISIADVINSSLDSYSVAGYNYTTQVAHQQALNSLNKGIVDPNFASPAWQGIFTIPVCDVGFAAKAGVRNAQHILKPYNNHDSRPAWCGPICSNDQTQTNAFIEAAQMKNFGPPRHAC